MRNIRHLLFHFYTKGIGSRYISSLWSETLELTYCRKWKSKKVSRTERGQRKLVEVCAGNYFDILFSQNYGCRILSSTILLAAEAQTDTL